MTQGMNDVRRIINKVMYVTWAKASYSQRAKYCLRDDINQIFYTIIEEIVLVENEKSLKND